MMVETNARSEDERLQALHQYDVLDTPPEESFDRITRLAQIALKVPIALVSLIDENRQWFKSRQGLEACETPRAISFCTHAIEKDEPLIVKNALEDTRFCENPLVTGEPNIRFYIGVPLRTPDGYKIGTLCAIDRKPRDVSATEIAVLQDLARLVIDELELRKIAMNDSLTGAMTRRAFAAEAVKEIARARRHKSELACLVFDVDHFKTINDQYGHAAGDSVLQTVIETCKKETRSADLVGRMGGEEFAILLPNTTFASAVSMAERLRKAFAETVVSHTSNSIEVTASFGVTSVCPSDADVEAVVDRADRALYDAKSKGRNRVVGINPESANPREPEKVA